MKYYIASSTADVQKLIEEEGELDSGPQEPPLLSCMGRILWYSPHTSMIDCGCGTGSPSLAGLVQVPWPRRHRSLMKGMKGPDKLEAEGAIVFGYNSLVPWHWPEIGDPQPGPPPELEIEDSVEDSGLGSSKEPTMIEQSSMAMTVSKPMLDHIRGHSQFSPMGQSHNTYGDSTVRGGNNILGNSYQQTINNYHQQTADISVQSDAESNSERKRSIVQPSTGGQSKRSRFA